MPPTPPATPAPDASDHPAAALLRGLRSPTAPPFALLHRRTPGRDADVVEVMTGPVRDLDRLAEIPDRPGERWGALALVPFRQLSERGFDVVDDGTPLTVLLPDEVHQLPVAELLPLLPDHAVTVRDEGFDLDDDAYAATVRRVLDEEIAAGEGANFVVRRTFRGTIDGYRPADALALFRRLLTAESGAYWTFVVHTGRRTLVGAGPEVHVRASGGTVVMNPVSGTYRYPPQGPDPQGLLAFLADAKERDELSMVVDEELKMMCAISDGGTVVGPRLAPMAHLAHTEFELRGRTVLDTREVLRETMFAATVTGSPVRNACRVIRRHEADGRGYYAGALALLGRDAGGAQTLDSPILIRTADIDAATGRLRVGVGATLVRGSDPRAEVAETHAKAAGVLAALGVRPGRAGAAAPRPPLGDDPRVRAALDARRAGLAPFWLRLRPRHPLVIPGGTARRGGPAPREEVLVVDAEDDFTAMLAHVLRATGRAVRVVGPEHLAAGAGEHRGPVVLGPGPGDPADPADRRIGALRRLAAGLLAHHRGGVVGVCLGHQLLATALGLPVRRLPRPAQGVQREVELFGRRETVGFYNSFTARCDDAAAADLAARSVAVARDADGTGVLALRGPGFAGVQFHPESVLTLDGPRLLDEALAAATRRRDVPAG